MTLALHQPDIAFVSKFVQASHVLEAATGAVGDVRYRVDGVWNTRPGRWLGHPTDPLAALHFNPARRELWADSSADDKAELTYRAQDTANGNEAITTFRVWWDTDNVFAVDQATGYSHRHPALVPALADVSDTQDWRVEVRAPSTYAVNYAYWCIPHDGGPGVFCGAAAPHHVSRAQDGTVYMHPVREVIAPRLGAGGAIGYGPRQIQDPSVALRVGRGMSCVVEVAREDWRGLEVQAYAFRSHRWSDVVTLHVGEDVDGRERSELPVYLRGSRHQRLAGLAMLGYLAPQDPLLARRVWTDPEHPYFASPFSPDGA